MDGCKRSARWGAPGRSYRVLKAAYLTQPLPAAGDVYRESRILAIVDMEGDGVPEIVFHRAEDTAFWNVVVGLDTSQVWAELAQSAAGGTL